MTKIAERGLILIFGLTIVFHVLVLAGIIPYTIIWGGRLTNELEMYGFEAVLLLLNLFFMFIILIKAKVLLPRFPGKIIHVALWIMAILFVLNTVGSLLSTSHTEKIIFTPITILLSIFCIVLIFQKRKWDQSKKVEKFERQEISFLSWLTNASCESGYWCLLLSRNKFIQLVKNSQISRRKVHLHYIRHD